MSKYTENPESLIGRELWQIQSQHETSSGCKECGHEIEPCVAGNEVAMAGLIISVFINSVTCRNEEGIIETTLSLSSVKLSTGDLIQTGYMGKLYFIDKSIADERCRQLNESLQTN